MATSNKKLFITKSEIKSHDVEHKRNVAFSISRYDASVQESKHQYADLERARKKAKNIKWKAIEHLDNYLVEFEEKFTTNGGKVIWAQNDKEAREAVLEICKKFNATKIVKSKSMVSEEIQLNDFLKKNNIESLETDLGEYIQQLDGEAPYHIVTPAMHKSKEDVSKLFHEKLNTDAQLAPNELTLVARKKIRPAYGEAQIGITGGNFLLADIGGVAVTENEGNARLCTSLPPVHIAIVGIEKMLASVNDLQFMWPLLSTYGTGQQLTVYNSIFTGPRKEKEADGPTDMYVILLDNGRANLIKDPTLRESTYCIRCGACLNACPIYKNIGGHSYNTTYSGPIGSVISPHLDSFKSFQHLSEASTLCGQCTAACPVKIDVHGMLHYNRTLAKKKGKLAKNEKWAWRMWHFAMKSRSRMDLANGNLKTKVMRHLFKDTWGKQRDELRFGKSFKQLYKNRK